MECCAGAAVGAGAAAAAGAGVCAWQVQLWRWQRAERVEEAACGCGWLSGLGQIISNILGCVKAHPGSYIRNLRVATQIRPFAFTVPASSVDSCLLIEQQ